jgi:hypothetical protein
MPSYTVISLAVTLQPFDRSITLHCVQLWHFSINHSITNLQCTYLHPLNCVTHLLTMQTSTDVSSFVLLHRKFNCCKLVKQCHCKPLSQWIMGTPEVLMPCISNWQGQMSLLILHTMFYYIWHKCDITHTAKSVTCYKTDLSSHDIIL